MKNLFSKLGLPETASENDAIAAVDRLQTALNAAQTPPLDRFVPRGEFDRVNGELIALNARVEGDRKAARDKEVSAFIETAVKEGKVAPASKDHFLALCATDAGFEQVKALVAASASFFKPANLDERAPEGRNADGSVALNAEQRTAALNMGIDEKKFAEFIATQKTA